MAPCLSNGRLPSLANASELRDVEIKIKCKARAWCMYKGARSAMAPRLAQMPWSFLAPRQVALFRMETPETPANRARSGFGGI